MKEEKKQNERKTEEERKMKNKNRQRRNHKHKVKHAQAHSQSTKVRNHLIMIIFIRYVLVFFSSFALLLCYFSQLILFRFFDGTEKIHSKLCLPHSPATIIKALRLLRFDKCVPVHLQQK